MGFQGAFRSLSIGKMVEFHQEKFCNVGYAVTDIWNSRPDMKKVAGTAYTPAGPNTQEWGTTYGDCQAKRSKAKQKWKCSL